MWKVQNIIDAIIKHFMFCLMVILFFLVGISMFHSGKTKEASLGSFSYFSFNSGWTLEMNGERTEIELPRDLDIPMDTTVVLHNTLPLSVQNGMHLCYRANMEYVKIYIDGELRESYDKEGLPGEFQYPPSAYIVTTLSDLDAGKPIDVEITIKNKGILNSMSMGYGNNVWFPILEKNLIPNVIALMTFIQGAIVAIIFSINHAKLPGNRTVFYMSFIMITMSLWVLSESKLRQLIFARPSFSNYFSYLAIESVVIFVCAFMDGAQHKRYHKQYLIVETCASLQITVNLILELLRLKPMHETIFYSHVWMVVAIILAAFTLITDLVKRRIRMYLYIALGLACFIPCCAMELIGFYVNRDYSFGSAALVGLILLMIATLAQSFVDEMKRSRLREKQRTDMLFGTIETIASAIDAKDEYTGGHSDRVGEYAERLARAMAADYDFTEEDILRIHYIGLMHDIGKIGVADPVLNKAGKLTPEEFSLISKHVDIGYELLHGMEGDMKGLLDGIRYHHERFDGQGYPDGLAGAEIPLEARILCLADCFDAMTSNRVYRKRLLEKEVRAEILRCAGSQFDPALCEIFVRLIDSGEMKPVTKSGMATNAEGELMVASALENFLQTDLLERDVRVHNPSHVRMLCYIIKLMEKKGAKVTVIFADVTSMEELQKVLGKHDLVIEYIDHLRIIALFDKTDEEIAAFKNGRYSCLKNIFPLKTQY